MEKLEIPMRVTACEEIFDNFMFPVEGGHKRSLGLAYKVRLSSSIVNLGESLTPVEIALTLTKPLMVGATYQMNIKWVIANE